MKTQHTPTSRTPQGEFSMERWRKLYVVSAVETPNEEHLADTEPSGNLARIFVVLLLVHVFLIGAIVLYNVFSDHGRGSSTDAAPPKALVNASPSPTLAMISPKGAPSARGASPSLPGHHVVQSGESLNFIAQSYGVDQQALIRANHLGTQQTFDVGLDLIIPAKTSPVSAVPKAVSVKAVAVKAPEVKKAAAPAPAPIAPPARAVVKNDPPKPAPAPVIKATPVISDPPPSHHAGTESPTILVEEAPPGPISPKPGEKIHSSNSSRLAIQDSPPESKTKTKEAKPKTPESKSKSASDSPPKTKSSDKVASSGRAHIVTSSDTLYGLAHKYKVKVEDLMKLNGITDPKKLRDGLKLKIPVSKS